MSLWTFLSELPFKVAFVSICRNFWDCGLVSLDDISVTLGDCRVATGTSAFLTMRKSPIQMVIVLHDVSLLQGALSPFCSHRPQDNSWLNHLLFFNKHQDHVVLSTSTSLNLKAEIISKGIWKSFLTYTKCHMDALCGIVCIF